MRSFVLLGSLSWGGNLLSPVIPPFLITIIKKYLTSFLLNYSGNEVMLLQEQQISSLVCKLKCLRQAHANLSGNVEWCFEGTRWTLSPLITLLWHHQSKGRGKQSCGSSHTGSKASFPGPSWHLLLVHPHVWDQCLFYLCRPFFRSCSKAQWR